MDAGHTASDTTVQALTSSPTVRDGVLIYEDSPLVRAAKEGMPTPARCRWWGQRAARPSRLTTPTPPGFARLVLGALSGYILVVDEADKAPTHVTAVLKTLVEDGEMLLTDGRRLIAGDVDVTATGDRVIPIHPVRRRGGPRFKLCYCGAHPSPNPRMADNTGGRRGVRRWHSRRQHFRMIVLANRPGFPFLGNDFYREIGDVFSGSVASSL